MAKPPGTLRIALLGASYGMGSGVENSETFEAIFERQLNEQLSRDTGHRYEILNFCVGGYSVLQSVYLLENKVFDFDPDVVMQLATNNESEFVEARFRDMIQKGTKLTPELDEIRRKAELAPEMDSAEFHRRVSPFLDDMIQSAYARITQMTRQKGAIPVWLLVPRTEGEEANGREKTKLERWAREFGFVVLSLEGAYGARDLRSLWVAPWDEHPNAEGHNLLAAKLLDVWKSNESHLTHRATDRE
jgi:hypothetical protein